MEHPAGNRSGLPRCSLTVIRLVLGIIFLMHGSQKVLGLFGGGGLSATVANMTSMGLPVVLAYMVSLGEFLGGIALFFGFLTRVAATGILVIMIGAVVTIHAKNGFFLNWFMTPGVGHGYEYNLALIAMSAALVVGGPGVAAVDGLIFRRINRSTVVS